MTGDKRALKSPYAAADATSSHEMPVSDCRTHWLQNLTLRRTVVMLFKTKNRNGARQKTKFTAGVQNRAAEPAKEKSLQRVAAIGELALVTNQAEAMVAGRQVLALSKKAAANRRNAQLSTGPRTKEGKSRSRQNAVKHGILSSALLILDGDGAEDRSEFDELLSALRRDLAPVGMLEEMLVEKIAVCWWRQKRALKCEAGLVRRAFVTDPGRQLHESLSRNLGLSTDPELANHLSLPLGADLDLILRYETANQRSWSTPSISWSACSGLAEGNMCLHR